MVLAVRHGQIRVVRLLLDTKTRVKAHANQFPDAEELASIGDEQPSGLDLGRASPPSIYLDALSEDGFTAYELARQTSADIAVGLGVAVNVCLFIDGTYVIRPFSFFLLSSNSLMHMQLNP